MQFRLDVSPFMHRHLLKAFRLRHARRAHLAARLRELKIDIQQSSDIANLYTKPNKNITMKIFSAIKEKCHKIKHVASNSRFHLLKALKN